MLSSSRSDGAISAEVTDCGLARIYRSCLTSRYLPRQDALDAIRHDACDVISIYPGKNGGILRSLEIAQLAATAGLRCTIGSNLEMDLGTAAMLELAIAAPALATDIDHDAIGPLYYARHFTAPQIQYVSGCAIVPEGAGLGVEFHDESR